MASNTGTGAGKEKRRSTEHDVVLTVVGYLGVAALVLAGALAICLVVSVLYAAYTGKEIAPGVITSVIAPVSGALGAALGYIGGVLSNAFRPAGVLPSPAAIGQGMVDAAKQNDGMPVKDVEDVLDSGKDVVPTTEIEGAADGADETTGAKD